LDSGATCGPTISPLAYPQTNETPAPLRPRAFAPRRRSALASWEKERNGGAKRGVEVLAEETVEALAHYAKKLTGKYRNRIIKGGVGHNLPQEAPRAFAEAVINVSRSWWAWRGPRLICCQLLSRANSTITALVGNIL
jgi:hypothetical protein